jgi:hypothetical protein
MDTNLVAAIVGAIAAVVSGAIPYIVDRVSKPKQILKFVYIKVIHLTRRSDTSQPVYKKFVQRLGREVEIYDEYSYFRFNVFKRPQKGFTSTDRSSGVVDLKLLYPWQDTIRFSDKDAQIVENIISHTLQRSSNMYFTEAMYFNGFQPGHENVAMKMEDNTQEARMVIDFSSLPNHEFIVKGKPKAFLRAQDEEKLIGITEPSPGVFSVAGSNLLKDQVLGIDFEIDWEKLSPVELSLLQKV